MGMATGFILVSKHLLAEVLCIPDDVDIRTCGVAYRSGWGEYVEIGVESDSIPDEDDGKQFDVVVTKAKMTSRLVRCTTPPRLSHPEVDDLFNELRKIGKIVD